MTQVAQNLIDNALKYSPRRVGVVRVEIVTELTADEGAAAFRLRRLERRPWRGRRAARRC